MKRSGQMKSGSALVAVFWIMSILSLAVFTAIQLLYYEVDLVTAKVHGNRAEHFAEMGIALAANPVMERDDPLLRQEFEGGTEGFEAKIRSEASRFNINLLLMARTDGSPPDKGLMRDILAHWGMDFDDTQDIVDALVDWVDEDDFVESNGAEEAYYEELGIMNQPYNRPFYALAEMRLVRGWNVVESLNPNWQNWFTIWTAGALDVNEADPQLIAIAAEIPVTEAQFLQDRVLGADGIRGTDDDAPFSSPSEALDLLGLPEIQRALVEPRLTANDPTTRLESTGWSGDTRRRITLILRNRTGRPSILDRREETVR